MNKEDGMDKAMATLSDRVIEERQRRALTQEELADLAGVKLGMLSNFERKRTTPQAPNLRKILKALDLEAEAGDVQAAATRSEWPADVQAFLDVMGVYLTSMPEGRRREAVFAITRQIVAR